MQVNVLISHPGDVAEDVLERVYESFNRWNGEHRSTGIRFYPFEWQKDIAATAEVMNGQNVIDLHAETRCDATLALFNTRLGCPTNESLSGTVHEIEESVQHDKYTGIIVDQRQKDKQEKRLRDYLNNGHGLYKSFDSFDCLDDEVRRFLDEYMRRLRDRENPNSEQPETLSRADSHIYHARRIVQHIYNPYFHNKTGNEKKLDWHEEDGEVVYAANGESGIILDCIGCEIPSPFSEQTRACCRAGGLSGGVIRVQGLFGKLFGIISQELPHMDFDIPANTYIVLVFVPYKNKKLVCNYLGLTSSHIFPFSCSTAPEAELTD